MILHIISSLLHKLWQSLNDTAFHQTYLFLGSNDTDTTRDMALNGTLAFFEN